ncbi:MAG: acyltransferase family protein [Terriglobia bacterium]
MDSTTSVERQVQKEPRVTNADGRRLRFIDGLRGVAASMVVLYHLGNRTGLRPITEWGYLGVGIFFVISGFVITSTQLNKTITPGSIARFFARRFVRLDIPYWVNIAVTVVLGGVLYRFGGQFHHYTNDQIIASLLYLQGILGLPEINQVYWTLCFEIQFYLALVLVLWLAQRFRSGPASRIFQWAIVGSILVSVLFGANVLPAPRGLMFPYWWAFALGAMTCWWRAGYVPGRMLAAAFLVLTASPFFNQVTWRITAVVTAALLVLATRRNSMGKWLGGRIAQFFGRISYSLYLFHALIGWEAQTFADRYVGQYEALAFGIAVSVVSAWVAYALVERPAVNLSHRIKIERAAPRANRILEATQ